MGGMWVHLFMDYASCKAICVWGGGVWRRRAGEGGGDLPMDHPLPPAMAVS